VLVHDFSDPDTEMHATFQISAEVGGGWTDDGEVVRLTTSSDKVGIGTVTPAKELEVISQSVGGGVQVYGDASVGSHDSPGVILAGKDIGGVDRKGGLGLSLSNGHYSSNATQGDLVLRSMNARIHFATKYPGYPAKMTIAGDGNVGIGTTEPSRELQVVSRRAGGGIEVYGNARAGTHDSPGFHLGGVDISGTDREAVLGLALSDGHYSASAARGDLVLRAKDKNIHCSTESSGGYRTRMTLSNDGVFFLTPKNLHTTHPRLSASQFAVAWNHSGGRGETVFYQHGGSGWRGGYDFWSQRNGVGKKLLARLEDTGNLKLLGSVSSLSDARVKNHIQPISNALAQLMDLRGVRFRWVDESIGDGETHLGLIAQEVLKVVPEVVVGGDGPERDDLYGIQYDGLVPLLIEALKQQQLTINALTRRLEKLEERNEKTRVDK
jgi:hypothetical protein